MHIRINLSKKFYKVHILPQRAGIPSVSCKVHSDRFCQIFLSKL